MTLPAVEEAPLPAFPQLNSNAIDAHFPKEYYREGQKEAIEFAVDAFNNGKTIVILECPTGSGKSPIGMTIADMVNTSYYLTITKILQDQLTADFGKQIVELKGRNAYPCTFYNRIGQTLVDRKLWTADMLEEYKSKDPNCANGFCRTKWNKSSPQDKKYKCDKCFHVTGVAGTGISKGDLTNLPPGMKYSACPYYEQVHTAIRSRKVVMNFSSFLYQTQMTKRFDNPRNLMIIDECLHPHTRVQTESGLIPIGKLVNDRLDVRIASFNFKTQLIEYKRITRWLKRDKQLTYKVLVGNRVLYPTMDHKLFTPNGKKKLSQLNIGDEVYVRQTEITPDQQQLVLGSLLGDASLHIVESKRISKKYVNKGIRGRVRFRHGPKQFEYLMWKYRILQPHAKTIPILKPSTGFTKTTASFNTNCNFYEIIEPVLINNRKSPNPQWLEKINAFGLAVWYMDDGGLTGESVRFNSHGFSKIENQILVDWLKSSWNLDAKIHETYKHGKLLYYIQLGRRSTRLLMRTIAQYIPEHMRYKLQNYIQHDHITGEALNDPLRFRRLKTQFNTTTTLLKPLLGTITEATEIDWVTYDDNIETQICCAVSAHKIMSLESYKETYTYDLEIEDNHNYFAGNALVSNCHNLESQLLDFVSFSITDLHLNKYGIFIPEFEHAIEYAIWMEDTKIHELLLDAIKQARADDKIKLEDELARILKKYKMFIDHIHDGHDEWVCEYEEKSAHRRVTLKPVFAQKFVQKLLFRYSQRILMMSATVLDVNVMCRSLGIDRSHVAAFRVRNRFPKENRPIYIRPVAKMTGGKSRMGEWAPLLVKGVNKIVTDYAGKKGIIHTHNFAIMDHLLKRCAPAVKKRFINQHEFNGDKKALLIEHAHRSDSVIIAPAMHEGIDLVDDLSRFQIICKVPYANCFDDEQLARRIEIDRPYYTWLTALKLVQSYGRSIRSETDYADTFILDEAIYKFMRDANRMLPIWFKEAIHDEGKGE